MVGYDRLDIDPISRVLMDLNVGKEIHDVKQ